MIQARQQLWSSLQGALELNGPSKPSQVGYDAWPLYFHADQSLDVATLGRAAAKPTLEEADG